MEKAGVELGGSRAERCNAEVLVIAEAEGEMDWISRPELSVNKAIK